MEERKSKCCNAMIAVKESGVSQMSYDLECTCSKCGKELNFREHNVRV